MLKEERQQFILNETRIHNKVLLGDLAEQLNVSIDTVRRDVKELDQLKKLKKVHGGAISNGFNIYTYTETDIFSHEEKAFIAKKSVSLIPNNGIVLISGGTTNLEIARHLPVNLKATFFTPSLPVAMQLMTHEHIEVLFIGGRLLKDSQLAVGPSTIRFIQEIRADVCFMTTNSIDEANGMTDSDWDIVQMKKAMLKSSKKIVAPVISEKLGSSQRYQTCTINEVDVLVTELDPFSSKLEGYRRQNIEII
ncbi:DeoR/GlpR family DNA-binding transcription regulator [Spongiivirga citrea]|uniref:DeoR family transcriptional regulator n=1 Tax=Spongiivirga citrea TaxID=1481457 RepID=A0A6M0CFL8_9FLAO|nr:DeoR/GlpR family DNA-binding transcription regulator [Spongiivirga citrea]NER15663.1 DeoR family transcriptional regulator [Spongiivirga citrea]